jgi:hypothetical protein
MAAIVVITAVLWTLAAAICLCPLRVVARTRADEE